MFSFGDDRNPSNDTVNVMEEILVEYIVDVVRPLACEPRPKTNHSTVSNRLGPWKEEPSLYRRLAASSLAPRRRE